MYIYFHICTIGNWKNVVNELLKTIQSSGLFEDMKELRIGVLGDGDVSFFETLPKTKLLFQNADVSLYERPTLLALRRDAMAMDPNTPILYIHSKGVSGRRGKAQAVEDWRHLLSFWTIERYEDMKNTLQTCDAVGINLKEKPRLHFSGNFWWSKASYLRTLPETIGPSYCDPEYWIGRSRHHNFKSLFDSKVDHYKTTFPSDLYKLSSLKK
ncbi:MAG: hypothetical protein ABGY96_07835 [bacterium]